MRLLSEFVGVQTWKFVSATGATLGRFISRKAPALTTVGRLLLPIKRRCSYSSGEADIPMDCIRAAKARAARLVSVGREGPSGGFYIVLRSPSGNAVYLGPYANPAVAKLEASRVRSFVAAVIQQATCSERAEGITEDAATCRDSVAVVPYSEIVHQFQSNG